MAMSVYISAEQLSSLPLSDSNTNSIFLTDRQTTDILTVQQQRQAPRMRYIKDSKQAISAEQQ